jgi:hypothetical protein
MRKFIVGAVLALATSGCYHATIETGLQPGTQTISKPWALSFVYGLVPPPTVETAQKCPTGVAKVETKLSFLNQLVGILTWGLFTPMEITVTCAAPRAELPTIRANGDAVAAVKQAADLAVEKGSDVLVRF